MTQPVTPYYGSEGVPLEPDETDDQDHPKAKDPSLDLESQEEAVRGGDTTGTQADLRQRIRNQAFPLVPHFTGEELPQNWASNQRPPADPSEIPGTPEYDKKQAQSHLDLGEGYGYGNQIPTSPPPRPKPIVGGVGGGSAGPSPLDSIRDDYNQELEAKYAEKRARQGLVDVEMQGAGKVGDINRETAAGMEGRQNTYHNVGQHYTDELYKMTHAYADGKVDPDKFWHDKNVPQKIATIVGAALLSAGSALTGGGASAGVNAINAQIDRSIALQQASLDRKRVAAGHIENLYGLFLHQSKSEMEAYEKTRAVYLDAAIADIAKSRRAAKGKIEDSEMDTFIASLRLQRDELMARARASGGAGGSSGAPQGWLEVDSKNFVTGADGQQYLINNPQLADDVTNQLSAFARIRSALQQGAQLMEGRDPSHPVDFYNSLKQGEVIDSAIAEAEAKLAASRGLPPNIMSTVRAMKPSFGSVLSPMDAAKIPALHHLLEQWEQDILRSNNARPFDIATGPGVGKHAGELKTYGRPSAQRAAAPGIERANPYARFQPSGQ